MRKYDIPDVLKLINGNSYLERGFRKGKLIMSIESIGNYSYIGSYAENSNRKDKAESDKGFVLEGYESADQVQNENTDKVPEKYAGMSFWELISSEGAKNRIPVVNAVVTAKNPEDEKIYVTFFTDRKIFCQNADGSKVWEMGLENQQQRDKVQKFFSNYKPDRDLVKEYYSDAGLGIVSSRDFWIALLEDDAE